MCYVILLLPRRFYYYPLYKVDEVGHDGVAYVTVFLDIRKPEHSKESHARQDVPQGHVGNVLTCTGSSTE